MSEANRSEIKRLASKCMQAVESGNHDENQAQTARFFLRVVALELIETLPEESIEKLCNRRDALTKAKTKSPWPFADLP